MTTDASGTADMDIEIDVDALNRRYAEERAKRLRTDGNEQYARLEGKFADFDRDIYADPNFTRDAVDEELDVLIIGGGFAGMLAAIRLSERGIDNFRIVEKGADVGGTWYWNRYPGAASDVEGYVYLPMLEELGYLPKNKYSPAPEIYEHCQKLAKRYELYPKALFQTRVTGDAKWDEASSRWIVTTDRGDRFATRFLLSCTGTYDSPKLPNIKGVESFEGHAFHTSRWDYNYTGGNSLGGMDKLNDKVVGVIGTGATAVQCIPHLAASAKHLYVFQRTPSSVDVRNQKPTDPEWAKSLKPGWQWERTKNFTSATTGEPVAEDLVDDGWTDIIRNIAAPTGDSSSADGADLALSGMKKMELARRRVDSIVKDPQTAEALKPYYAYFCKRPCFHDEYLPVFNRPNVTLVDTQGRGVEEITAKGPVVAGKEYPVDCIVYATGFEFMTEFVKQTGYDLVGRGGQTLSEHWSHGARTLWGIQTSGFPNFFLMALNQAGVGVNYVHMATEQTAHFAWVIDECLKRGIASVELTEEAEEAWVQEVLEAAKGGRAEFLETCTPSHYNHEGKRAESARLNDLYAGGPGQYVKKMEAWRADGTMPGFRITKA